MLYATLMTPMASQTISARPPLVFGDLTPAEAQDNLAAFAETVMPALIRR
jgi:hypothetical protein